MRKILFVIFIISVLLFTFTFFSCGEKTDDNSNATSDTTNPPTTEEIIAAEPVTTTEAGPKKKYRDLMFAETDNGADQHAIKVGEGGGFTTIGAKFTADFIMTDMTFSCPSWSDDIGFMIFKIYKWDTDYAKTVAGTAVFTDVTSFVDYSDNATVEVIFDSEIEPGTYLWEFSEGKSGVGIWAFYTAGAEGLEFYKNGELFTDNSAFNAVLNGYIME